MSYNGEPTSSIGVLMPNNDAQMLSNCAQMSSNGSQAPSNGSQVPSNDSQVPSNDSQVPSNGSQVPSNSIHISSSDTQMSSNGTQIHSNAMAMSSNASYPTDPFTTALGLHLNRGGMNLSSTSAGLPGSFYSNTNPYSPTLPTNLSPFSGSIGSTFQPIANYLHSQRPYHNCSMNIYTGAQSFPSSEFSMQHPASNPILPMGPKPYPANGTPYPIITAGYPTSSLYPPPGFSHQNSRLPLQSQMNSNSYGLPNAASNIGYPPSCSPQFPTSSTHPATSFPQHPSYPQPFFPPSTFPSYLTFPRSANNQNSLASSSIASTSRAAVAEENPKERPSITPVMQFDPSGDAALLRHALQQGLNTNSKLIIQVLGKRTFEQRRHIAMIFQQAYRGNLVADICSELNNGLFLDTLLALLMPLEEYLATELHRALATLDVDEDALVQILCTADNYTINSIKREYQRLFQRPLEQDILGETESYYRRLLVGMASGIRDEKSCSQKMAKQIANQIFKTGEGHLCTNKEEFNRILASNSYPLLTLVFKEYKRIRGRTFEDAVKTELSGDNRDSMLAIYYSITNRSFYFAKCIYGASRGLGGQDRALIRLLVSRAEIDLQTIKEEFMEHYEKPLSVAIQQETSGDYQKLLLAIIGE